MGTVGPNDWATVRVMGKGMEEIGCREGKGERLKKEKEVGQKCQK